MSELSGRRSELAGVVCELLAAARTADYARASAACVRLRGGRLPDGTRVPGLLTHGAGTRDPETCTTAELCELLDRVRHPGAMWFLEWVPAAERLLTVVVAQLSPRPSANEDRDAFIYRSMRQGKGLDWIRHRVNQRRGWEDITSRQGVSQAAERYARRHGLPWPIQR